jgi:hypothetical protein
MLVMNFINYCAYYFDYIRHEINELNKITDHGILSFKIRGIMQKHQVAINLAHSLNGNVRFIILIAFISNTFIACFDMFRFIFVSIWLLNSREYFKCLFRMGTWNRWVSWASSYWICTMFRKLLIYWLKWWGNLFELLIKSTRSNRIIHQSSSVADELYNLPWHNYNLDMRKNLLIMLLTAQRPQIITCWNMFTISLNTFLTQLRAVVSYITAMRTIFITNAWSYWKILWKNFCY